MPRTTEDHFASADLVFIGEVIHRDVRSGEDRLFGPAGTAILDIARVLKGDAGALVSIELGPYSALQGEEGDIAQSQRVPMLVFAYRADGQFTDGWCSGTGPIAREDERLHALGFKQGDFEALGLPTDDALMRRLAADWEDWRLAVLACEDADCYRRLRRDDRLEHPVVAYYQREFERERAFYRSLPAPHGYRLVAGVVGPQGAQLRYRLMQAYQPANELPYDAFIVSFRATDRRSDQWLSSGARLARSVELPEVRADERVWLATDP